MHYQLDQYHHMKPIKTNAELEEALSKAKPEELLSAIGGGSNIEYIEILVIGLLEAIIKEIIDEHEGKIDVSILTQEQIKTLEQRLDKIAETIEKNQNFANKELAIKMLFMALHGALYKKFKKRIKEFQEQQEEDKHVTEYKKLLKRLFIYEFYKFTNPNRLAGEDPVENFINNVVRLGVEQALQIEKVSEATLDPEIASRLDQAHKNFGEWYRQSDGYVDCKGLGRISIDKSQDHSL